MESAKPSDEVRALWKKLCRDLHVENSVQLFATEDDELTAKTRMIGYLPRRPVLQRSDQMEKKVMGIAEQLIDDYNNHNNNAEVNSKFDGMLYMMGRQGDDGTFLPLYVGRPKH
jgi:hypothetical protein